MSDATILARLVALEARVSELESGGTKTSSTGKPIADDDELDSERGDVVIKRDPKNWQGESFAGCSMSQCPPKYLRMVASLFDWMAEKDDEQGKTWKNREGKEIPASTFKRRDARLARGWAKRNEKRLAAGNGLGGGTATTGADDVGTEGEVEIPFILDMTGRSFDRP